MLSTGHISSAAQYDGAGIIAVETEQAMSSTLRDLERRGSKQTAQITLFTPIMITSSIQTSLFHP